MMPIENRNGFIDKEENDISIKYIQKPRSFRRNTINLDVMSESKTLIRKGMFNTIKQGDNIILKGVTWKVTKVKKDKFIVFKHKKYGRQKFEFGKMTV